MTPHFKFTASAIILLILALALSGCQNSMAVLDGATHACGSLHVEGYVYSDNEANIRLVKVPPEWTPEQIQEFCP